MSQSTPPIVTLAAEFSGQQRSFPEQGSHVTMSEIQSLSTRLHDLVKTAAALIETVEQIRKRTLFVRQVEERQL